MTIIIISAIVTALVKIAIEYKWYARVKNEKLFHGIGLLCVSIIFALILFLIGWREAVTFAVVYYNVFEMVGNIAHRQYLFYVGQNSTIDNKIHETYTAINRYYQKKKGHDLFLWVTDFKAFLHILTLLILLMI